MGGTLGIGLLVWFLLWLTRRVFERSVEEVVSTAVEPSKESRAFKFVFGSPEAVAVGVLVIIGVLFVAAGNDDLGRDIIQGTLFGWVAHSGSRAVTKQAKKQTGQKPEKDAMDQESKGAKQETTQEKPGKGKSILIFIIVGAVALGIYLLIQYQNKAQKEQDIQLEMSYTLAMAREDYQLAIQSVTELISRHPDNANLYAARCLAYASTGVTEWVTDCDKAIELDPKVGYQARGNARIFNRDYMAAIEDFDRALQEDPNPEPDVYAMRGLAHYMLGHKSEAIYDFNAYLKLAGDNGTYSDKIKQLLATLQ